MQQCSPNVRIRVRAEGKGCMDKQGHIEIVNKSQHLRAFLAGETTPRRPGCRSGGQKPSMFSALSSILGLVAFHH